MKNGILRPFRDLLTVPPRPECGVMLQMMKSLIIDDEPSARARLARMLAAHPSAVSVIGEARDGLDALEKISSLRPDLVFLDVEMPGLNGVQVLQSLPESARPPLVIFTTGYDQH